MKLRNLFWGGLVCCALAVFTACNSDDKGELGNPALTVSVSELTFDEAGSDKALTLNATRDWRVSSCPEWVVVTPASGKASADDQTVVVSALANTGANRNGNVVFTIGTVQKTVVVNQAGSGVTPSTGGDGTAASPYTAAKAHEVAASLSDSEQVADVYVKGVVKSIKELSTSYGNATYTLTDADNADASFSVYRGKNFGGNAFTSEDQLAVGDVLVVKGTLVNYMGNTPQFTTGSQIVERNGQTSADDSGSDDSGEAGSDEPIVASADDFASLTANASYVTVKSTQGWSCVNCAIQKYGTANSGADFAFVPENTKAVCMNGKTSMVGTITSPVIAGGCGTLSFSYCAPFSEANGVSFKVEVLQGESVVKTFNVVNASAAKLTTYTHTEEVNVAGNFRLKFTNNSPSNHNASGNKDRFSVWNITWTGKVAE